MQSALQSAPGSEHPPRACSLLRQGGRSFHTRAAALLATRTNTRAGSTVRNLTDPSSQGEVHSPAGVRSDGYQVRNHSRFASTPLWFLPPIHSETSDVTKPEPFARGPQPRVAEAVCDTALRDSLSVKSVEGHENAASNEPAPSN